MKRTASLIVVVFVVILFGLFLLLIRGFLSPLLIAPVLLYLLYRNREHEWAKGVTIVTVVLFLVWFFTIAKGVLAPFVVGFLVGYLFNPIVDRLETLGIRRTLGIITVAVPIILLIVFIFMLLIPKLVSQLQELFSAIPTYYGTLQGYISIILDRLRERGIVVEERGLIDEALRKIPSLAENLLSGTINVVKGIGAVITFITYLVVIPIVSFYWMRDSSKIYARFHSLIPKRYKKLSRELSRDIALIFERYVRGQLLMSLIVGVLTTLLLWAFGIQYSILLGIVAGVLNIIPRIGFILSIIPALLVGVFTHPPLLGMGKVIGVFVIVVVAETVISPRVLGGSVRLHPLTVLLAVFLGTFFFGVVGLILAVPAVAIIKLFLVKAERGYLKSKFYGMQTEKETEAS